MIQVLQEVKWLGTKWEEVGQDIKKIHRHRHIAQENFRLSFIINTQKMLH